MPVTRRSVLLQIPAFAAAAPAFGAPGPSFGGDGLNAAAQAKGLAFGSAVNITSLRNDPRYGQALARECGILVAENEMKMEYVEPVEGKPSFAGGDEIAAFARGNDMRLRGHTLVWYRGMPPWAMAAITPRNAEALMRRWIGLIAGRYKGQIEAWDVVNEVVDPRGGRADGLRATPWLRALGPQYIDLAFTILRDVDPQAAGTWNEDDVELGADWMDARRAAVLKVLEQLLKRDIPIRRLGLQCHLNSLVPLDAGKLRRFLAEVAGMGLGIEITELDVDDRAFPPDPRARDGAVADFARRFLDVVFDERNVLNCLTWDIVDRNTWLNTSPERRRRDGLPQRSLPLDDGYARKPLWSAIRQAFLDAPDHSAWRSSLRRRA